MRPRVVIRSMVLILALLLMAGCQHPDEVVVTPEEESNDLVLTPLVAEDSITVRPTIDSLGITQQEELRYAGLILLNQLQYNAGQGVKAGAFSWIYFADRTRPLLATSARPAYYGIRLDPRPLLFPVTVNGAPMLRIPHRVHLTAANTVSWGYEYIRDLSDVYAPVTLYRWEATPDTIGTVSVAITSPDTLAVIAPAGGSLIARNQDLMLRWMGKGDLVIIVSTVNAITHAAHPVLHIRPKVNTGKLRLPARVLQSLPNQRYLLFSFVLANRTVSTISRYAEVLIQAASVYNCYVEIH